MKAVRQFLLRQVSVGCFTLHCIESFPVTDVRQFTDVSGLISVC